MLTDLEPAVARRAGGAGASDVTRSAGTGAAGNGAAGTGGAGNGAPVGGAPAGGARTAVARLVRTRAEERSWLIAASGEGRTADRLDRFAQADRRWRVLHGVRRAGPVAAFDHLAIGPGGVFVISSRRHPRARVWVRRNVLVVNGQPQPYVRAARDDAMQVAVALGAAAGSAVAVRAVVVIVDADDLTVTAAAPDVGVLHQRGLIPWLLRQPEVVPDGTLSALQEIAERPSTWDLARS